MEKYIVYSLQCNFENCELEKVYGAGCIQHICMESNCKKIINQIYDANCEEHKDRDETVELRRVK